MTCLPPQGTRGPRWLESSQATSLCLFFKKLHELSPESKVGVHVGASASPKSLTETYSPWETHQLLPPVSGQTGVTPGRCPRHTGSHCLPEASTPHPGMWRALRIVLPMKIHRKAILPIDTHGQDVRSEGRKPPSSHEPEERNPGQPLCSHSPEE